MTLRQKKTYGFFSVNLLLMLSIGISDVATDIYLPTMPLLIKHFFSTEEMGALTVSSYLFAFCFSGPIYGPFSDSLGRRNILLFGMGFFSIFSCLCIWAWSIESLIFFRFMQGIGGGAAWILSLAIVKDTYAKDESVDVIAKISLVIALSPAAAPIVGGYMGAFWGWRSTFYSVAIASLVIFSVLVYSLPESLPEHQRVPLSSKKIIANYWSLMSSLSFMSCALISAFTFSALFAYISIAPFFFIKENGLSVEEYGYHQMVLLIFYMIGTFLNTLLVKRWGSMSKVLGLGIIVCILGGLILFLSSLFLKRGSFGVVSMGLYCLGNGIVLSNASTQAMQVFPAYIGGSSAALLSALEMFWASIAVGLAGGFYEGSLLPIGACILVLSCAAGLLYFLIPKENPEGNFLAPH